MHVILTDNPSDVGERPPSFHQDCACDCDCACPTDGAPIAPLSYPVAYYLELTPACNNRCPGCGNLYTPQRADGRARSAGAGSPPSPPLNGREWRDLIARLAAHAGQLKLTGGEATLHPAFAQIVQAVEDLGIPFTLFTNGRWPHPDRLMCLLRRSSTCEGLLVSLHGPDAASHETFCGVPGSFEETVTNIRRATAAGLQVATSFVINHANWDRVEASLDLALGLGAHHVVCNRYIGLAEDAIAPSRAQLRAAMATIASLRGAGRPIRFGNCIPQCFAASSARGCTAGSTFATIDPWGRVRPCNHAPLVTGDLRTQSVQQAWNSPAMAHWRALVPADCAPCPAFAACHGGCRAQALLAGEARDPLIRAPLERAPASSEAALRLYGGLRLLGRFAQRRERDAHLLLRKSQVTAVPAALHGLAGQLDGSLSLQQIKVAYGQAAVEWVGALYQTGMVGWAPEQTP